MPLNTSPGWSKRGLVAVAVVSTLLLLCLQLVEKPEVQAVTHAVIQPVTVLNEDSPSAEAEAEAQVQAQEQEGLHSSLSRLAQTPGKPITLPFHEVSNKDTHLVQFQYAITLDEKILGENHALLDLDALRLENKYGLLFVQIINGGDFYLNGHWVAGLARSSNAERHIWYEPFVVPLPSRLLRTDNTPNVLTISQSTLEPYISISRLYFGEAKELARVFEVVHFVGTVLANVFITLCLVVGLFFLGLRLVSPKEQIYAWAGCVCILSASLLMVSRMAHTATDLRELWRWIIYLCEGGVVAMMSVFILSFIGQPLGRLALSAIFSLSGFAAVAYAVGGGKTERYLDLYWLPAMFMLYGYATARLFAHFWRTRSVTAGLFLLQTGFLCVLGFHASAVQSLRIDDLTSSGLEMGWSGLLFEHIKFLHLGLPFLVIVAGHILIVTHRDNIIKLENSDLRLQQREIELQDIHSKRERLLSSEAKLLERERIYQDLHDGIGSQLITAIFSLRRSGSDSTAVVDNLQACLRDLRLVIDAQPESDIDIQTTVFAFCVTQELQLQGSGLKMSYDVGLESIVYSDPKVTLNVLRVLQESLSNTIKHSGATVIDIAVKVTGSHVRLTITDNGNGHHGPVCQSLEQLSAYGTSGNRGVTGLALRAADIGAKYTIQISGSGTQVALCIPLQ